MRAGFLPNGNVTSAWSPGWRDAPCVLLDVVLMISMKKELSCHEDRFGKSRNCVSGQPHIAIYWWTMCLTSSRTTREGALMVISARSVVIVVLDCYSIGRVSCG
jgi:hypothetical protein